jgi:glutamate formiminotransferase
MGSGSRPRRRSARVAPSRSSASSTRWPTASTTACGEDARSASAGASFDGAASRWRRAPLPVPDERGGPGPLTPLECVANVSEGRDQRVVRALADACAPVLLDVHADPGHHRSVFTLAGPPAAVQESVRSLARLAVAALDLSAHHGAHPRFGVIDVVPFVPFVPFVPLDRAELGSAIDARDSFAAWASTTLGLPCFLYGPMPDGSNRPLPEVRRRAFHDLAPDLGPRVPHPSAGAVAVGARRVLVAYNLWLAGVDFSTARRVAVELRGPSVRALAFELPAGVQVSCNLLDPMEIGPAEIYDRTLAQLRAIGSEGKESGVIRRAELVGLVPAAVLARVPPDRWLELDLGPERTIEARLESRHASSG